MKPPEPDVESQTHSSLSLTVSSTDSGEEEHAEFDKFLVVFEDDDPECPLNWPKSKKITTTLCYAALSFSAQMNSAIFSPAAPHLVNAYGVSTEVATLSTSLFMAGIAFGPLVFAPFSEVYGRRMGVLLPAFISLIFTIATGGGENIQSVLITRFFTGFFAASPIIASGGILGDIWLPEVRASYLVISGICIIAGPNLAPPIGALLLKNSPTAWKWVCWFPAILMGCVLTVALLVIDETYHPVILQKKAKRMRLQTGEWAYHSKHDEWNFTIHEFAVKHLIRPFAMLATPICLVMALYASFCYGVFFLTLTSVNYQFSRLRHWGYVESFLPTLAVFMGACLFGAACNLWSGIRYGRVLKRTQGKVVPEERLVVMVYFGWVFTAGMFITGWTSDPKYHWSLPCLGLLLTGWGFFVTFQACLNYLVDAFPKYAASAVAANTFLRSAFAVAFPLFARQLFDALGVNWGLSLLGFVAVVFIPVPWIFYKFGKRIRERSPFGHMVD